jgi:hypothetical protein
MKYMRMLAALAVLCLFAAPALSAQSENGPAKNANTGNNCKINCNENGPCAGAGCPQNCCENGIHYGNAYKTGSQDGTGNQIGNGQNGNQQGAQDGTGPKRDGSCGNCKR